MDSVQQKQSSGSSHKVKAKVCAQTKSVLKTVLERCKKEGECNRLLVPLHDVEERASYYTGFPKHYMLQLNAESSTDNDQPTGLCRIDLLLSMKKFNLEPGNRTFSSFYDKFIQTQFQQTVNRCRQQLVGMGFSLKRTTSGLILMEDPRITFERFHYIKKILKCRELNKHVYYIDVRIINTNASFKKPVLDNVDSVTQEMILYHILSKDGYGNCLFCYQINREDFKKWLLHIVLPSLRPSSVIVIEDNPYHGTNKKRTITRYESKSEMMKWLKEYNIPCNNLMRKAELYDLIEKCTVKAESYNVDSIFKSQGHEVLRLPSNLLELSLTDIMWKNVKSKLERDNIDLTDKVATKMAITRFFESIPKDTWKIYENSIIDQEKKFFNIDVEIENVLEKYKLEVNELTNNSVFGFDIIEDSDCM